MRTEHRGLTAILSLIALLAPAGCGDNSPAPGAPLTLTIGAVDTCGTWQPDHQPGVSYQTPTGIRIGLESVKLMRSHKDPAPVALPLSAAVVEVDASSGGVAVTVNTGTLAEDTFTHVRLGVAFAAYHLEATGHASMTVPGDLEIDMALSNHEYPAGRIRSQGQYAATFTAFGQTYTTSGQTPLNCTLSAWGGIANTTGTRFEVSVPLPGGPLGVDHARTTPLAVELAFPVRDIYSWRDLDVAGYANGVLDLAAPPAIGELPDAMAECQLLMADRCQGEGVAPLHPTWPMPDSNLTFCTDGQVVVPTCQDAGQPGHGQDAHYLVNTPMYDARTVAVTDLVTDLVWQRQVPAASFDWWEARDYCAGLSLEGQDDWRLPSRVELVSLLDYGVLDPTIDATAFPQTPSDFFWTSSPVPFLNLAYGVRFELGFIYDHDPYGSGRVRCVRRAYHAPEPRFVSDGDVVTDQGTGLAWQRHWLDAVVWLDALAACEVLDLGGHQDWRLPTVKELQTLVDDRRLQPSIDVVTFPDTPSEWFWSSTPIAVPPSEAWATSYTDGYASIMADTELHLVRCVRDP